MKGRMRVIRRLNMAISGICAIFRFISFQNPVLRKCNFAIEKLKTRIVNVCGHIAEPARTGGLSVKDAAGVNQT